MARRDSSRSSRGGRRSSGWFYMILAVVFVYFGYCFVNQQAYLNGINEKYQAAEQRLAAAQKVNAALRDEKAGLEDLRRVEKVAREQLNMVRSGEMPYILPHGSR